MRLDTRTFELTLLVDSMIGRTLCYRKLLLLLSTTRQGRLCLGTRARSVLLLTKWKLLSTTDIVLLDLLLGLSRSMILVTNRLCW